MSIKVTIDRQTLRWWEANCKEAFPQECYGILAGHERSVKDLRSIEVRGVYIPPDFRKKTGPTWSDVPDEWMVEAGEYADDLGCSVVGDIHSHPFQWYEKEVCPSAQDFQDFTWNGIAMITNVCQCTRKRDGRHETYLRAKTAAFPPLIRTELEVV